ncbi:LptF/LptG family permease [Candidatus Babeliales bacterium]|nr:LptF/LptG family permease [Candidatus Babeliales bacterium]
MIIARYLRTKLLTYFILINGTLTTLYSLIGFVEKLMRENSTIKNIAFFSLLNILPTFFELIPLSSWLATCLFIWELYQTSEWESLSILSLKPNKVITTLSFIGILLASISFLGKEVLIYPIIKNAEEYKIHSIKNEPDNKVFNQWMSLENNTFLHFDFLDLKTYSGSEITIFYLSENFVANKKIKASNFILNPEKQIIFLKQCTILDLSNNDSTIKTNYKLQMPELFLHLKMFQGTTSLKKQIKNIILASELSSSYPLNQEAGKLLARLLSHIQPFIYILLTLSLFFLFYNYNWVKWMIITLPYPFILISNAFSEFMLQHNTSAIIVLVPYMLSFLFIYLCLYKLKKV